MWPFRSRERPDPPQVVAARAAQARAERDMGLILARTGVVDTYVENLKRRRLENNFGDALEAAMGRRV